MQGASVELRGEILEAAAQEASRLELVQSEVREMHRTKASHRELQHLVRVRVRMRVRGPSSHRELSTWWPSGSEP